MSKISYTCFKWQIILINFIILEMQIPTMSYGARPFGVGMILAGYDVFYFDYK